MEFYPEDAMPDVLPVGGIREKLDEIARRVRPGSLRREAASSRSGLPALYFVGAPRR